MATGCYLMTVNVLHSLHKCHLEIAVTIVLLTAIVMLIMELLTSSGQSGSVWVVMVFMITNL